MSIDFWVGPIAVKPARTLLLASVTAKLKLDAFSSGAGAFASPSRAAEEEAGPEVEISIPCVRAMNWLKNFLAKFGRGGRWLRWKRSPKELHGDNLR